MLRASLGPARESARLRPGVCPVTPSAQPACHQRIDFGRFRCCENEPMSPPRPDPGPADRRWRWRAPAHAQHRGRRRCAASVLRYAFPVAETGFDPAQISDLYSRTVVAGIFEAPLAYDYLARPVQHEAEHGGGDARGQRRLPQLHLPHPARHLLRRRPGLQGQPARAGRAGLRLQPQAPLRPALQEPQPVPAGDREDPRPGGAAQAGARRTSSPSTTTARSRACARWTATPSRSSWPKPRPRFHQTC